MRLIIIKKIIVLVNSSPFIRPRTEYVINLESRATIVTRVIRRVKTFFLIRFFGFFLKLSETRHRFRRLVEHPTVGHIPHLFGIFSMRGVAPQNKPPLSLRALKFA